MGASWVPRINITRTVSVTPTVSTTPAYTAGDQIGGIMQIDGVVRQDTNSSPIGVSTGQCELAGITILDNSKQDSIMDIWFFKVSPTVTSTDNAAFAMTLANQNAQCIGQATLTTSNGSYSDAAAVSTGTWSNLNIPMQVDGTSATPTSVFAIAIARGTPTYATTTALQFKFSFYVD